jgi:hypothetical protein
MTFCCKLRLERLQSYSGIGQIICSLASRDRMQLYGAATKQRPQYAGWHVAIFDLKLTI